MTGSDPDAAPDVADTEAQSDSSATADAQSEGDRASQALRRQIAALRKQVKEAQDSLRDQERLAGEGRTFKR